jgi:hypothetical protein
MAYDSPNANTVRETHVNNLLGTATTAMKRILFTQKAKLLGVKSLAITAGTNDAAGVDILIGTTSVGAVVNGTTAAGAVASSGDINSDIAAGSYVELKGLATSATMVNSYSIVYEVYHDDASSF